MAATSLNVARLPVPRRASVDVEFGGTLAGTHVTVPGPAHFARDGYVFVGCEVQGNDVPVYEGSPNVTFIGEVLGNVSLNYVIVGEKTLATSGNVNAATWSRTFPSAKRPSFYPEWPMSVSDFWGPGDRPFSSVPIKFHDRRLNPFFHRLAKFEGGDWDSDLGRAPSKAALTKVKAVLHELGGGPLMPTKLVGGDGVTALYFSTGAKYSTIEISNNGVMLMLNSTGQGVPEVERFTLRKLPSIIVQIRAHIA